MQRTGRFTASFYIAGEPDGFKRDWFYVDEGSLSATAHPILTPTVLNDASGKALRSFVTNLRPDVDGAAPLQPPLSYMHHNAIRDTIVAANDALGIGKLYSFKSDGMAVLSNSVIAVALLKTGVVEQEDEFWDAYYVSGGGLNDTTYVQDVDLSPPGSLVSISEHGVSMRQHTDVVAALRESRGTVDLCPPIRAATRVVEAGAPYMNERTRLRLSGGVDSRFVAGVLINSGIDFDATTYVPPALESDLAAELHSLADKRYRWEAIEANPGTVRQDGGRPQNLSEPSEPILARALAWFDYLGGDHWSTLIRSNAPVRKLTPSPLMILGSHGDITRSHYYSRSDAESGSATAALERFVRATRRYRAILSADLRERGTQLIKNSLLDTFIQGFDGFYALDYAYFYNRVRRQFPPVSPSALLPMLTWEMLLATFWQPPHEKEAASAVRAMTSALVPSWAGVPYYHEAAEGTDPLVTNKVSVQRTYWEVDRADFIGALESALDATKYSGISMDSALREIDTLPEGRNRTNQTLEFVFWHHAAVRVLDKVNAIRGAFPY